MAFYGNPDDLERIASEINTDAAHVRDRATQLVNRAASMQWHGTAADRFRELAREDRDKLFEAGDGLDHAADELRKHAGTVRERLALISKFENQVSDWFQGAVSWFNNAVHEVASGVKSVWNHFFDSEESRPTKPWAGLRYGPDNLPEAGHKDWIDVGEYMQKNGKIS
jgi:uncharacterized protein YukE